MAAFGSSNNGSDDASLCANNCGFYGCSKNQNMCSICYAAFLKRQICKHSTNLRDEEPNFGTTQSRSASESCGVTSESVADFDNLALKTKNRCRSCKKKVGVLGFNCRCGGSFCGKHRYPEEHSCDVDHKAIGREILAKQIVECKADKLEFKV